MKKALLALLIISSLVLVIVFNFSEMPSKYACNGVFSSGEDSVKGEIFVKLNQYRFWVALWSHNKSDGSFHIEIPNELVDYYSKILGIGEQIQIYENDSIVGNFSKLSKTLAIKTPKGFFDGKCTKLYD